MRVKNPLHIPKLFTLTIVYKLRSFISGKNITLLVLIGTVPGVISLPLLAVAYGGGGVLASK
jgi:hypothetical protein